MFRKALAFFIAGSMLLSGCIGYADTLENVQTLKKLGLVTGVTLPGGRVDYKLESSLTRAEAAVIMFKLSGGTLVSRDLKKVPESFKDVKRNHWAFKYISYCVDKGILSGMPGGVYKPEAPLSEKAFLAMLLKLQGYTANDFTWDTVYVSAYEAGLVEDVLYTTNPDDNISYLRGQAFDTLHRGLQQKHKSTGLSMLGSMVGKGILSYELALESGLLKRDQKPTTIESVNINENSIAVNFSEDIKDPLLQNVKLEIGTTAVRINDMQLVGGKKLILKIDSIVPKSKYVISVSNVEDIDGNVVSRLSSEVTAPSLEVVTREGGFRIASVRLVGSKSIIIEFNRNLSSKALQELMYTIERQGGTTIEGSFKNLSLATTPMKNAVLLTLKSENFIPDQKYSLKIKGDLTSVFGEYLNDGNGDSIAVDTVNINKYEPIVEKAYTLDSKYLSVQFNERMSADVDTKVSNYQLLDTNTNRYIGINEIKYYKDEAGKAVYVFRTDGVDGGKNYNLTVKVLSGQFGEVYRKEANFPIVPERKSLATFNVEEVKAIDTQTIKIRFNRAVHQNNVPSISIDKLSIYRVINDPNDMTSFLVYLYSPMNAGQNYNLKFPSSVMDLFGTTYGISNYSFTGVSNALPRLAVSKAYMSFDNRVTVNFNRDLDTSRTFGTGRVELDYTINGVTSRFTCDSIEYINNRVVVLHFTTPLVSNQGVYDLRINGVSDLYNNYADVAYRVE